MYLLDTHTLLWWLLDRSRLSPASLDAIRLSPGVYVSAASAWEIAIKKGLSKLSAPDDLAEQLVVNQFRELPVTVSHSLSVLTLPLIHGDPFDRLLVAQAKLEGLVIVTRDADIPRYGVPVLAA